MSQPYEKLKALLKELFQLDQPDLDFGFYRVMHARSAEVTQFLEEDLLPQVKDAFAQYQPADKAAIEKELAKVIVGIEAAGMNPNDSPKVKELRAKLADDAVDLEALEGEVYDHLYSFFRRYYSEGDFLSKRVYKAGVYAIPYEGEEVKLHWANADQYYIKTSEYLRDYTFRLRPDDDKNAMRVHFRLVEAAEGEHGNVKEQAGKERRFKLAPEPFAVVADGELVILFTYARDPAKQKELNVSAETTILGLADASLSDWVKALSTTHVRSDGTSSDATRLRVHLDRYTARNTFDYFIHKNLGRFLRQELDFYIKNEVMHLDDVENENAQRVEQYVSKIKVIRRIAGKIITFLAQLEDFQKSLWCKRKLVVETQYCVSLDKVPEDLYPEVASNRAQREDWVRLFAINEIEGSDTKPGYSDPLSIEFLKANRALLIDTQFFSATFAARLLHHLQDLDTELDGVLVHGDNFHALNLLGRRFARQVSCVYIDPPYNTAVSAIPYKNDYRHSSWTTMIRDRLELLHATLRDDGLAFVSIDKNERLSLEFALRDVFGAENKVEELVWVQNTNDSRAKTYSTNHEYVAVFAKRLPVVEADNRMFREIKPGFQDVIALVQELNPSFPSIAEVEAALASLYDKHRADYRTEIESQELEWENEKRNDPWKGLYPYNRAEYRDSEGRFVAEEGARTVQARIWVWREDNISLMAAESKQSPTIRDPQHPNFRFYAPPHPVTGKPCAVPKGGWKYTYDDNPDYPERKSFRALDFDHRIEWGSTEQKVPQLKRMLHEVETNVAKSVIVDYADGEKQTAALFGRAGIFLAPKHSQFVRRFIVQTGRQDGIVVDCFGGSGSTAHAVIEANQDDNGKRKYVLAEVSDYFDTILKPRVLKAAYSRAWRSGKPVDRQGVSHVVKVIRLESYEDALNNLRLRRTEKQQGLLDLAPAEGAGKLKEQYVLQYMLDVETRGSQSLLNIAAFTDPTAYTLKVKRPGSDESREANVDLLETFNWLIGIAVQHIAATQAFRAEFERDGEGRLRMNGQLKQDAAGPWWFRTVTGTTPDGRNTLVVWRKRPGGDAPEGVEQDNVVLDEWFTKQGYSSKDSEFDLIYVNGGNNLENLKAPDDTWKVRLIEEDFFRLMFETDGI